ncbi:MBL fold metallo-hydrolase [Solibacillus sp. FSL K6-1523]|uniref:MBL fold metallo-hydrolase n=1 Tax=Solibacillus sp. FSL K6-1523 TaxID=2921471 RepID=UPI0030F9FB46
MKNYYGVFSVDIPLPFRLNQVNCFIGRGNEGWAIIDTGLNRKVTMDIWKTTFNDLNMNITDIESIFLTHMHIDHYGLAGELQRKSGATVYMSEIDIQLEADFWTEERDVQLKQFYRDNGIEEAKIARMFETEGQLQTWVNPRPKLSTFEDGDFYKIGDLTYQAIHTPGHSDGHFSLYNREEKILFSGDHVLPKITPNISVFPNSSSNPLKEYLESLDQIKELDVNFVIPSHGEPFEDLRGRVEEIKGHHDVRLQQIYESLSTGCFATEVCQKVFGNHLSSYDYPFAFGEILAHLNYLVEIGEIEKEGHRYYRKSTVK